MIVVAGAVRVRPERRAEAVRVAVAMAEATRAEPGCLSYRFAADLGDPNTLLVFEEWEDDASLARHFETEHMASFRRAVPDLVAGPAAIRRYVVDQVATM